jgi:hypothetical protein
VTIGLDSPEVLRRLSDARELTCPGCDARIVLHAGSVRAHHFAHLPKAVCSLPQTEPETEEHRAGKLLIARWLRERLPESKITVEAFMPGTKQRADVLLEALDPRGGARVIAIEFQCANLAAREWQRRHALYHSAGIQDLWFLGGSRFRRNMSEEKPGHQAGKAAPGQDGCELQPGDLERVLLSEGVPLIFLDSAGTQWDEGAVARFRPAGDAQVLRPRGRVSTRLLLSLQFPWHLLDRSSGGRSAIFAAPTQSGDAVPRTTDLTASSVRLWQWLEQRYQVTPGTLPPLFGLPIPGQDIMLCEPKLWQAAAYYRFIHRRVGERWWIAEVETWARAYLPLAQPLPLSKLQRVLGTLQELFSAAGLLTLPTDHKRANARIAADLDSLSAPPSRDELLRLARYRRLLNRA